MEENPSQGAQDLAIDVRQPTSRCFIVGRDHVPGEPSGDSWPAVRLIAGACYLRAGPAPYIPRILAIILLDKMSAI